MGELFIGDIVSLNNNNAFDNGKYAEQIIGYTKLYCGVSGYLDAVVVSGNKKPILTTELIKCKNVEK